MNLLTRVFGRTTYLQPSTLALQFRDRPAEMYHLLQAYYLQVGLYDQLKAALYNVGLQNEALKPLRCPAHRVVEFYADKLWPGTLPDALPVVARNQRIVAPIQQVWAWSNFGATKQVWARWQALYGDLFVKVASRGDPATRVYLQLIEPEYVPDFDTDERGYLTYVRFDVPVDERQGDEVEHRTYTEVWDKALQTLRVWRHDKGYGAKLAELGPPVETPFARFGIDFVPVVHVKHRDLGDVRGASSFGMALDKIDEANRVATRLHRMLFRSNRATWVITAGGLDGSGRPIPPPKVDNAAANDTALDLDDDKLLSLPGAADIKSLVPNINYAAALDVLNAHMTELEHDLPELAYYRVREMGEVSGRAVRLLLGDAIDRLLEARGNAEAGLVRAQQMALTLGTRAGLWSAGEYETGDFEHSFAPREVIDVTPGERAEAVGVLRTAGLALVTALRLAGFDERQIEQAQAEAKAAALDEAQLATAYLDRARREFDQDGAQ